MKNAITHIVVQSGYAVFGTGPSRQAAINDAVEWIEDAETATQVSDLIVDQPNVGDFTVLECGRPEFDSYLTNQGGFTKIDGEWFAD